MVTPKMQTGCPHPKKCSTPNRNTIVFSVVRNQELLEKTLENWQDLCALAATEQDPEKLTLLIAEIMKLLAEKQARLNRKRIGKRKTVLGGVR